MVNIVEQESIFQPKNPVQSGGENSRMVKIIFFKIQEKPQNELQSQNLNERRKFGFSSWLSQNSDSLNSNNAMIMEENDNWSLCLSYCSRK